MLSLSRKAHDRQADGAFPPVVPEVYQATSAAVSFLTTLGAAVR